MTLIASKPGLGSSLRKSNNQSLNLSLTFATDNAESLQVHALTDAVSPGRRSVIPLSLSHATENAATYAASLPLRHSGVYTIGFRYKNSPSGIWKYVQPAGKRSDIELQVDPHWLSESVIAGLSGGYAIHDAKFLLPELRKKGFKSVVVNTAVPDKDFHQLITSAHHSGTRVLVDLPKASAGAIERWISAGVDGFHTDASRALAEKAHLFASRTFPENGTLDGTTVFVSPARPTPIKPIDIHKFLQDPFHRTIKPLGPGGLALAATLPGVAKFDQLLLMDPLANKLSKLKNEHPALQSGAAVWVPNNQEMESAQLASFARLHPEENLIVCVNMSENPMIPATITLPAEIPIDTEKKYVLKELLSGEVFERSGEDVLVLLGPGQSQIFQIIQ